jgi:hypothetical protein
MLHHSAECTPSIPRWLMKTKLTALQTKMARDRLYLTSHAPNFMLTEGLTGGLLVIWCRHGIAIGFHNIPVGEGRNDVFSVIYTRFPTPPKFIIYDFACTLGPYSLLREAEYFKNPYFLMIASI